MIKNCSTCALGTLKNCPAMGVRPKQFCFAWCRTADEWQERLSACMKYERNHKESEEE
jgi:hypothetical protein